MKPEWWRGTAQHMWRAFFSIERNMPNWDTLSDVNKKTYAICQHVYLSNFTKEDRELLKSVYSLHWEKKYPVDACAEEKNISVNAVWIVVKRANRLVMETIGLLEKRGGDNDE